MLYIVSRFFTAWVLIVVILGYWTHTLFDLLWLTTIALIGGVYLTYIFPKQYTLTFDGDKPTDKDELCWKIDGTALKTIDLFLHWIPWFAVLIFCQSLHTHAIEVWPTLLLVLVYLSYVGGVSKVIQVYQIRHEDMLNIVVLMIFGTLGLSFIRSKTYIQKIIN